jgi:PAS domain S-box-containing protein
MATSPTRILVVEDERIVAHNMRQQLMRLGYDVPAVAVTGEQALALCRETQPEIVLMDIHIPGPMDGIETASRLNRDSNAAIIYLTAHSEESTVLRARDTRPYGYLLKPFSERELHATIQMALGRREADHDAREASERLAIALDAADMGSWQLDLGTRLLVCGGRAGPIFGLPEGKVAIAVEEFFERVHAQDRPAVAAAFDRVVKDAAPCRSEFRLDLARQPPRRVKTAFNRLPRRATKTDRIAGVVQDVTAERAKDEELERRMALLKKTGETLAKIVEASPLALVVVGGDDRIDVWNPAAERIYGVPAAKAIGRPWPEIAEQMPRVPDIARPNRAPEPADGGLQAMEIRRRRPDGREMVLRTSAAILGDAKDGGVLMIADDVTQRLQLEARLRQSQKMEAIGQLTSGIAHDFNNLLSIILGNLELLMDTIGSDQALREIAVGALGAAERGAGLTHRLLAYARQQQLSPRAVEPGGLVRDLVLILRRLLEESIEIETVAAPDLWLIGIDANQLENALVNLAINARDAMPEGGRLTVAVENAVLDEDYAGSHADVKPGAYVCLSVTDTGVGMSREVAERATEPFFTTKPMGRGTGLGLSMVYGFVKQSGGHLAIYSEPGRGTTVRLYLPRLPVGEVLPPAIEEPQAAPVEGAGRVVLLVEDDPALRKVQRGILDGLGYSVIEAGDGPTGLSVLDRGERVDVLLTDVVLPHGMTGPDLVRAARASCPDLKVLFMSGYAPGSLLQDEMLAGTPSLTKPFTRSALARALSEVLDPTPR